jgi:hypothetical protein
MLRCQPTTFMIVDSSLVLHTGTFVPQHVAPPGYVRAGGWDYSVVWGHHQGVFQCYAVSISKKWMVQTCLKQKYLIYRCDRILFCKSHVNVEVDGQCTCILSTHFDMRCIYVPLIKGSGSHSAMPCQTFSQVQYRLCIRDFATLFAVPFPGVAQCSWLPPPAGDWDELFKNLFAAAFSICPISRKVLFPRLIARLMKQWPRVVDWGILGPNP